MNNAENTKPKVPTEPMTGILTDIGIALFLSAGILLAMHAMF